MSEQSARLIIQYSKTANKTVILGDDRFTIGRADDNALVLNDKTVSRYHAEITCSHMQYFLTDQESRNGTFVNDSRLMPGSSYHLADGDRIQIADGASLVFRNELAVQTMSSANIPATGLALDAESRKVWVDGVLLEPPFSPQQFEFLLLLYKNANQVCSREMVIQTVWSDEDTTGVTEEMVDALASRVRKRIREAGSAHIYIVTMRGHGFKFVPHS